jgi:hypothetical protein
MLFTVIFVILTQLNILSFLLRDQLNKIPGECPCNHFRRGKLTLYRDKLTQSKKKDFYAISLYTNFWF